MPSILIAMRKDDKEETTVEVGREMSLPNAHTLAMRKLIEVSDSFDYSIAPLDNIEEQDIRDAGGDGMVVGVNEIGDEVLLFSVAGYRTLLERLTEKGRDQWLVKIWSPSGPDLKA